RAEIYERLGIPTVATVAWTAGQILRRVLPMGAQEEYRDPSGTMCLAEVHVGTSWIGKPITELESATGARIAFITRYGDALLPQAYTVLQDGDLIHALYAPGDREQVERVFEHGPEGS
ncbi:MAG: TrkA C-terminal domain-containing protein, partial [Actinomycetes bacterium]